MSAAEVDVVVRDVGPRDGLQTAPVIATEHKVTLIRGLHDAGLERIEVGSFVSKRAVPQMADTAEVVQDLAALDDAIATEVLVVNATSAAAASDTPASTFVALLAASETFASKNVRMSIHESVAELRRIAEIARDNGRRCIATVSTAFGCAYEGAVAAEQVHRVVESALDAEITEITLCDTVGMAYPSQVHDLVTSVHQAAGADLVLGLHLHDTRGLGLANVLAGLDGGVRLFDASIGGLGGCPYSPGATGNTATEDLVHLLELQGHRTGIDLGRLTEVSRRLQAVLGTRLPSQVLRAGPSWSVGRAATGAIDVEA